MTPINLYDCPEPCDLTTAVKINRATWICAKCGADISMRYLMWAMALEGEE